MQGATGGISFKVTYCSFGSVLVRFYRLGYLGLSYQFVLLILTVSFTISSYDCLKQYWG